MLDPTCLSPLVDGSALALASVRTLAVVDTGLAILLVILALVIGAVGAFFGIRAFMGQSLSQARTEADQIIARAETETRNNAERIRLDAERQAIERKEKADAELDAARNEIREVERRLTKREDLIDRKEESLTAKDANLTKATERVTSKEQALATKEKEIDALLEKQKAKLHEVASLTQAQATEMLLQRVEEESRHEVAKRVRKINEDAEAEAENKAREITLMAIQRFATETVHETTVRTVAIRCF